MHVHDQQTCDQVASTLQLVPLNNGGLGMKNAQVTVLLLLAVLLSACGDFQSVSSSSSAVKTVVGSASVLAATEFADDVRADIAPSKASKSAQTGRRSMSHAATGLVTYYGQLWPATGVPIQFEPGVPLAVQVLVISACQEWTSAGAPPCILRTTEASYVYVTISSAGCFSYVGSLDSGPRQLNLGAGCWIYPTALHELGHALGLMHEHQRPDRNMYIAVQLQNVLPQYAYAFDLLTSAEYSSSYDFLSIMHYGATSGSWNGYPTLVALGAYAGFQGLMGAAQHLSAGDREVIGRVYGLQGQIKQMWIDVVGGEPPAGKVQALLRTGKSAAEIRAYLPFTAEATDVEIGLYRSILNRNPDDGGLAGVRSALGSTATIGQIRDGIAQSAESIANVTAIYGSVLGRQPDAGGLKAHLDAMSAGFSLNEVRVSIAHSAEAAADVTHIYAQLLSRAPTSDELTRALERLSGGSSLDIIYASVLASVPVTRPVPTPTAQPTPVPPSTPAPTPQPTPRSTPTPVPTPIPTPVPTPIPTPTPPPVGAVTPTCQNQQVYPSSTVTQLITNVYCVILHRLPDSSGAAFYLNGFMSGTSISNFVTVIFDSREAAGFESLSNQAFLTYVYRTILGREPDAGGLTSWTNALNAGQTRAAVLESIVNSPEARVRFGCPGIVY